MTPRYYMMASELIAELQKIVAEKGDMPVAFHSGEYDSQTFGRPVVDLGWLHDHAAFVQHVQLPHCEEYTP